MGEFFDIFNHRIISLFYRGWKKYRFYIAYEQSQGDDDLVTSSLYDLLGMGTAGLRGRMGHAPGIGRLYRQQQCAGNKHAAAR